MYVQGILSRAYGLPIERPKSVTMDWLIKKFGKLEGHGHGLHPK